MRYPKPYRNSILYRIRNRLFEETDLGTLKEIKEARPPAPSPLSTQIYCKSRLIACGKAVQRERLSSEKQDKSLKNPSLGGAGVDGWVSVIRFVTSYNTNYIACSSQEVLRSFAA